MYNLVFFIFTGCLLGNVFLLITSCLFPFVVPAQVPETAPALAEQQLEAMTENMEDAVTEDDSFLQSMRQLLLNPVNLNTADIHTLQELNLLSPLQVQSLVSYRNLLGNFISIYELQAVPGLDLPLIGKLRPYITVSTSQNLAASVRDRLKGGTKTILTRVSQLLEKQKGYKPDTAQVNNYYPGPGYKLLVRYKYQYKNLLQCGIVGEKDAGEQFFKGAQKQGFDFYSAHIFARNMGIIQSLALGDFTVNLGQGLIHWQSLAFKKSADIPNIKRQLAVLRPYNSSGEINFHRGAGITIAKKKSEATVFASYRQVDANFVADTLHNEDHITSFQTSGLHRTRSETADKGVQRQLTIGGNVTRIFSSGRIGINGVWYRFHLPVKKTGEPYNRFALLGKSFGNYSIDYSYGYRNVHFFGEAAMTNNFDKAFVNGLIISVDSKVDMSLLYRNIAKSYQSLYSNAFTENTFPTNEKGLFAGISIRPDASWRIDGYADFYTFPWLKYLVDAPSTGNDYMIQAVYKPNKLLEMYLRYRVESKVKNDMPGERILGPVLPKPRQNIRYHLGIKVNRSITVRHRVEMVWFDKRGEGAQNGFLTYTDMLFQPMMKRWGGGIRMQYFETEGYDSRLYAFENDVLYSFSIPVFYDKGYRYYLNFNYEVSKKLTLWLRLAQTRYKDKTVIGTGLDEIAGNKRTEVKVQAQYRF